MKRWHFMAAVTFALASLGVGVQDVGASDRLIKGTPVKPGTWRQVVRIRTGNSMCTATVVGPKAVLTAAHCASDGATSSFEIEGQRFSGKVYRSPLYPRKDHDQALIVLTTPITRLAEDRGGRAVEFATVTEQSTVKVGQSVWMLGFGCTQPGGTGGNDGILREGAAEVTGFSNYDAVLGNGVAACYGDSGGPTFLKMSDGTWRLILVTSKGNIATKSYNSRLDIPETKTWLESLISQHQVEICGYNLQCGGTPPPPPGDTFSVDCASAKFDVKSKGRHAREYVQTMTENLCRFLDEESATADDETPEHPVIVHPILPVPDGGR